MIPSDCKATIQATSIKPKNKEELQCMTTALHDVNKQIPVQYIPEHIGIARNKIAERLAKAIITYQRGHP